MSQPKLINVTEEIVHGLVRFLLFSPSYQTFCHCEYCELNIVANVLNKLPSNYVASIHVREAVYNKLNNPIYINLVNKEIVHVVHSIGKKPGH